MRMIPPRMFLTVCRSCVPLFLPAMFFFSCSPKRTGRETLSLNGMWEFAASESFERAPVTFKASIPVPGLIDLASAATGLPPYEHKVYWYRRSFKLEKDIAEVAL